jgi:signal recognition particle subunit SRP54
MFELLSEKIGQVFKKLGGKGGLTEKDVDEAMRQVRLALLEADVNLKVVKEFTSRVRERVLTSQVLQSLTPTQQVVKIVHEELTAILGSSTYRSTLRTRRPCRPRSAVTPLTGPGSWPPPG